jgi:hypothetical protein
MAKSEKKVRVQILPLHGIGGYGNAGDIVEMPPAEAEKYVNEGYVRVLEELPTPEPVQSAFADKENA